MEELLHLRVKNHGKLFKALLKAYLDSYLELLEKTKPELELCYSAHRHALLQWLRAWGCRQFVVKYEDLASVQIADWYGQFAAALPPKETALLDLSDTQFRQVEAAYGALVDRQAGQRSAQDGGLELVKVGPTGTAKILFALRFRALVPWDDPIRAHFGLGKSAAGYAIHLRRVRAELRELRADCARLNYPFDGLPARLGRPHSSLAKLVDEYFWVTITRKCPCPSAQQLQGWASWLQSAGSQTTDRSRGG